MKENVQSTHYTIEYYVRKKNDGSILFPFEEEVFKK